MQENREDVVFGTAVMGGFNRKNVLSYIEKLQNALAQNEASAAENARLLQQSQSLAQSLQEALDAANAEKEALQTRLDAAILEARQARAEAAQLRSGHTLRRGKK